MSQCSKNTAISLSLEAAFGSKLPRGKKPNIGFLLRSLSNISFCQMHIFGINFFFLSHQLEKVGCEYFKTKNKVIKEVVSYKSALDLITLY